MYWSSAGCFQPSRGPELPLDEVVLSIFFSDSLSPIMLAISEELGASSDRPGMRVDRLFADPEREAVADEGVMDNCGVSGM